MCMARFPACYIDMTATCRRVTRPTAPSRWSHPFGCLEAEQVEALHQHVEGHAAQGKPRVANGGFGLEDGALLVEDARRLARARRGRDTTGAARASSPTCTTTSPKSSSFRARARSPGSLIVISRAVASGRKSAAAEDRPNARGSVLQVGAGVAGESDHPFEVEHVLAVVRDRQVGVLDGSDADKRRDRGAGRFVEIGTGLVDDGSRLGDGLIEQGQESKRCTRTGLEDLAVLARARCRSGRGPA